jgi:hypothetical protein
MLAWRDRVRQAGHALQYPLYWSKRRACSSAVCAMCTCSQHVCTCSQHVCTCSQHVCTCSQHVCAARIAIIALLSLHAYRSMD